MDQNLEKLQNSKCLECSSERLVDDTSKFTEWVAEPCKSQSSHLKMPPYSASNSCTSHDCYSWQKQQITSSYFQYYQCPHPVISSASTPLCNWTKSLQAGGWSAFKVKTDSKPAGSKQNNRLQEEENGGRNSILCSWQHLQDLLQPTERLTLPKI